MRTHEFRHASFIVFTHIHTLCIHTLILTCMHACRCAHLYVCRLSYTHSREDTQVHTSMYKITLMLNRVYIYTCLACTHLCTHKHARTLACTLPYVSILIDLHICRLTHTHICTFVHAHSHLYMHTYAAVYPDAHTLRHMQVYRKPRILRLLKALYLWNLLQRIILADLLCYIQCTHFSAEPL